MKDYFKNLKLSIKSNKLYFLNSLIITLEFLLSIATFAVVIYWELEKPTDEYWFTVLIALGGVIGGLAVVAIIIYLIRKKFNK